MRAGRMVIADDEPEVAAFVRSVATGCGYEAVVVSTIETLNDELKRSAPTHIVLDLNMPGVDGIEILRHLAQLRCRAKIVIFSGADQKVREAARRLGTELGLDMAGVLGKPVRLAALRTFLDGLNPHAGEPSLEDVATAIAAGELFLEYQPKLALPSRELAGVEALVRWRQPSGKVVMPGDFLPAIEASEVIEDLTWAVMSQALDQIRAWADHGFQCPVSINLSSRNLLELDFADRLMSLAQNLNVPPNLITLELTETAAAQNQVHSIDILTRLRLKGFGLSIDDFGTGYASIAQLHRLPFDELKIDRSFVAELGTSDDAKVIVKAMIDLAHNLSLRVCAEGVETAAALETLERLGCDMVQGFHFSRAVSGAAIPAWANRRREPAARSVVVDHPALAERRGRSSQAGAGAR